MRELVIAVAVPDTIDPVHTDPHEIGEEMVDAYNETMDPSPNIKFVRAQWAPSTSGMIIHRYNYEDEGFGGT